MKHLKIYFAVIFFSFLGSVQNQVLAQGPEGSWTREFKANDTLSNGDYRAIFRYGPQYQNNVRLFIYKASDNSTVTNEAMGNLDGRTFISFSINANADNIVAFNFNTEPALNRARPLSKQERATGSWRMYRVFDADVEVTDTAYMKLESDGRFIIYSSSSGVPVVEIK
jgi:hypothetical protein